LVVSQPALSLESRATNVIVPDEYYKNKIAVVTGAASGIG
jgi:hypothetical protein